VKAVQTRTILYILVFVLTYGPTFAYRILQAKLQEQVLATTTGEGYYYNQEEAQDGASSSTMSNHETMATIMTVFALLSRILYPFHGIFNIMVHIQPRASSLCRANQDYYYLQALCIAIKTYNQGLDRRMTLRSFSIINRRRSSGTHGISRGSSIGITNPSRRGSGTTSITTGQRRGSYNSNLNPTQSLFSEGDPRGRRNRLHHQRRLSSLCGTSTTACSPTHQSLSPLDLDEEAVEEERTSPISRSPFNCKDMSPQQRRDSDQYPILQNCQEEEKIEEGSSLPHAISPLYVQMYEDVIEHSNSHFLSPPGDGG
jgi:hypothetical protein